MLSFLSWRKYTLYSFRIFFFDVFFLAFSSLHASHASCCIGTLALTSPVYSQHLLVLLVDVHVYSSML